MPKFRLFASYGWVGADIEEIEEYDTQEEADEAAREMAFGRVEWGAEIVGDDDE